MSKEGVTSSNLSVDPKDTIFYKMAKGDIKPAVVYEDDYVLAFKDINPVAPIHVLLISKKVPIGQLDKVDESDPKTAEALGHLMLAAGKVAKILNVADEHKEGYRLVINQGLHGQQSVNYLHVHFFAGCHCSWPPGVSKSEHK